MLESHNTSDTSKNTTVGFHLQSPFLGLNICLISSQGDSIVWIGLRTTLFTPSSNWEPLQRHLELRQGHVQTFGPTVAGQTPKQHWVLQSSARPRWCKLCAEPTRSPSAVASITQLCYTGCWWTGLKCRLIVELHYSSVAPGPAQWIPAGDQTCY